MKISFARDNPLARVVPVAPAFGLTLAPHPLLAATASGPETHGLDLPLVFVAGLFVGLAVWLVSAVYQRRAVRAIERRISQMTALIEHADCLLWEADVELKPDDWLWRMTLHNSAFCRKLFRGQAQTPGVDLWKQFQIDDRETMNRRARTAVEGGQPGYEQEFRAVRDGQVYWLHESVSITPVSRNRFWLVGLVTDLTARREAEEARRQSELAVDRILAHAQCLLWRATVVLQDGVLQWPHFDVIRSQLSEALFGDRAFSSKGGLWETLTVPEQAEMNERSARAILDGESGYVQQFRAINRTGRRFWLSERVSISRLSDTTWSLVGVATDITVQRETEEARRRSETQLAHLLERADSMLWQAKVERQEGGRLNWTMFIPQSQVHRRIFSAGPETLTGFVWDEKGMPEESAMRLRALKAITEGASGYDQVFRVPSPTGDLWLNETVTIVPAGSDAWDLVGIITDITARHQAEEATRESQERLRKLLALADCLLWEAKVTLTGGEVRWDISCYRTGLTKRIFGEALPPTEVGLWYRFEVPERADMDRRAREALENGRPGYEQQFRLVRPDGTMWINESVTITPTGPNEFWLVGLATDITIQRQAEAAQQASELRLAALLDRADCMIWQGEVRRLGSDDFHWKVFTPNSQLYRRLFGGEPSGECHFPWNNGLVPEHLEMKQRARQALTGGLAGYEQNFHYQLPTGEVWLNEQVTIKPLTTDHWELVGVITDVTAQRKSEAARQASEQRLQDILTRADCLLWEATVELTDNDWKWQFRVQPSVLCQKLYGVPRPLPEDGLWGKFNIPEWQVMNERCRTALLERRAGYEQVFHIVHADGTKTWISENVTISALDDRRFSLVGVALDITVLRGTEEALAAEKERLSVTLRAMSESVITTDVDGCIRFMNPAAAALTEWNIEECIGRSVQEVCRLQSGRNEQVAEVPVGSVAKRDHMAYLPPQTRLTTRRGSRRLIEGCCAPVHATNSEVIGTVLVFRDVTEQDRLEQELVRATRLESVGVLAGGIAHDFNNILTAVMGNLSLAQLDVPPDSPVGASLRSAEKAALRARDLTQQLLTFAKGGEPVRAAVQLDAIIREMTSFALHGSKVRAHYDMAPDLWPADADKGQIGRVVQNLVINAVQAMPHGGSLEIVVRNDPQDGMSQPGLTPGDYIQIAISDTGEGIKPENLARIFDPYFTTKQSGTGLGLAAVYSIVKKHRGHIEVDSQPGKGTTFRIWLPALRDRTARSDSRKPWEEGKVDRMKGHVLFMDDEQSIREMAMSLLQRFGLAVDCAADGAEAVDKYRAALSAGRRYDLVIMDLTVPGGMGGLAALGQLREIDPTVKAVVSSGYSSDPVLANFRAHGFAAMVAKPYEVQEFARMLREVLPGT
ncbi:MAG TPA: PAS domain S-box protein [Lacunisphaera sp.]